jgi:hypothetical protein
MRNFLNVVDDQLSPHPEDPAGCEIVRRPKVDTNILVQVRSWNVGAGATVRPCECDVASKASTRSVQFLQPLQRVHRPPAAPFLAPGTRTRKC